MLCTEKTLHFIHAAAAAAAVTARAYFNNNLPCCAGSYDHHTAAQRAQWLHTLALIAATGTRVLQVGQQQCSAVYLINCTV